MFRFEDRRTAVVMATWGEREDVLPIGARHPLGGENAASRVFATGRAGAHRRLRHGERRRSATRPAPAACAVSWPRRSWSRAGCGARSSPARRGAIRSRRRPSGASASSRRCWRRRSPTRRRAGSWRGWWTSRRRCGGSPRWSRKGPRRRELFDAVTAEMVRALGADGVTLARFESDEQILLVADQGRNTFNVPVGTPDRIHGRERVDARAADRATCAGGVRRGRPAFQAGHQVAGAGGGRRAGRRGRPALGRDGGALGRRRLAAAGHRGADGAVRAVARDGDRERRRPQPADRLPGAAGGRG